MDPSLYLAHPCRHCVSSVRLPRGCHLFSLTPQTVPKSWEENHNVSSRWQFLYSFRLMLNHPLKSTLPVSDANLQSFLLLIPEAFGTLPSLPFYTRSFIASRFQLFDFKGVSSQWHLNHPFFHYSLDLVTTHNFSLSEAFNSAVYSDHKLPPFIPMTATTPVFYFSKSFNILTPVLTPFLSAPSCFYFLPYQTPQCICLINLFNSPATYIIFTLHSPGKTPNLDNSSFLIPNSHF